MTTQLTDIGWSGSFGSGTWTNRADIVDLGDEIIIASGVTVNTLGGNDRITGTGGINSIYNEGTIKTDDGKDSIFGSGSSIGILLYQTGSIYTGRGNDSITAIGNDFDGINNIFGVINTGDGNDVISGTGGSTGIYNYAYVGVGIGTIITGDGNDTIAGIATGRPGFLNEGILNNGLIDTGDGNDSILGIGGRAGIYNDGTINTGNGNDIVDALTGGFDGGGTIYLDKGNDLIQGFGSQNVDGGKGFDTAELGIDYNQSLLFVGSSFDIQIGNMNFTNVEQFVFSNGDTFSLQDLQAQVQI